MSEKIIAAIATPQGTGGISVIRVSGEGCIALCDKVFRAAGKTTLQSLKGYTARYGGIYDKDELVDEVVCLVYKAPHSYTGEDVVEISCHGGVYITNRVLRVILDAGAKVAEGGEFTKRAFLNGKLDLTQAEAVMDIIGARGEQAARAALNSRQGKLFKKVTDVKNSLIETAAHLAAWADYPEEDVPEITTEEIELTVNKNIRILDELLGSYDNGKLLREGIDTVIIGRPNVGKSSIMNLLSGCDRSIVTDIEGTTRDIIEETVTLDDVVLRLSDTAGIRNTDNVIEKLGVDRALDKLNTCGLVIAVFDNSSPLTQSDMEIIENIKNIPCVAVINKNDLQTNIDLEYLNKKFGEVVSVSAKYDSDVTALAKAVKKAVNIKNIDANSVVLANERQREKILNAKQGLCEVIDAIKAGMTLDAVTVSVEFAVNEIAQLTGESASEEIIDNIFKRFCVGK